MKRVADQSPAHECRANEFQELRMPELEKFEKTGNTEYPECDKNLPGTGAKKRDDQTPEYLVEQSSDRIVEPRCGRSFVQFTRETEGHDQEQGQDHITAEPVLIRVLSHHRFDYPVSALLIV